MTWHASTSSIVEATSKARYTSYILVAFACTPIFSGCKQEISGTYLSQSVSDTGCLQIVRTPDNRLSGQLEATLVKEDGKLERSTIPITGAVNGTSLTLTFSNGFFGIGASTLSGILQHNVLILTGSENEPFTLKRSDLKGCAAQVNLLLSKAHALTEAINAAEMQKTAIQAEQAFTESVSEIISKMEQFESEADVHLDRIPVANATYGQITQKIAGYVEGEKQLAGSTNAGVARSQLSIAANQASFATDQLHYSAGALKLSLRDDVEPIAERANHLEPVNTVEVPRR